MSAALRVRTRKGAHAALVFLTLIWGSNWIAMKLALQNADPIAFNLQRTWLAVAVLFAALIVLRRPLRPPPWRAVIVTGFFQTTVNFAATTMALATGAAGRTSVLVFTMPFWTLLIAWPILGERVRGSQWLAVALAMSGLLLLVEPWNWRGELTPRLWAVLSGFGWAAGTVAMKYFQRRAGFDLLGFIAWQMLVGIVPLTALPLLVDVAPTRWSATQVLLLVHVGAVSTALGFLLWVDALRFLSAGTASLNMFAIPVIALLLSMVVFGEHPSAVDWVGIACIGAGLVLVTLRALRQTRRVGRLASVSTPVDAARRRSRADSPE
jgi:drug/metabolite transporter (DMT)-like permease